MTETQLTESQEILSTLRRLEGTVFASQIRPTVMSSIMADSCTCENCGCFSRSGDECGCRPDCACQSNTAVQPHKMLDLVLGVAATLPIDDIKTLKELRDKQVKTIEKQCK